MYMDIEISKVKEYAVCRVTGRVGRLFYYDSDHTFKVIGGRQ